MSFHRKGTPKGTRARTRGQKVKNTLPFGRGFGALGHTLSHQFIDVFFEGSLDGLLAVLGQKGS